MSIQDAIEQRGDHREQLRKIKLDAMAEIDRLMEILDTIDGDADLEHEDEAEPDNDLEPSLGSINPTISNGQGNWSAGGDADLEDEHDGREEDDPGEENGDAEEAEPSGIADIDGLIEQSSGCYISGRGYGPQTAE